MTCPCCIKKNKPAVDIYAERKDNGDISSLYVFGDDDFSLTLNDAFVKEILLSENEKDIVGLQCPNCNEFVNVNIPIIKSINKNKSQNIQQENARANQMGLN